MRACKKLDEFGGKIEATSNNVTGASLFEARFARR